MNQKLSSADLSFIKDNIGKLSMAEISRKLNCSVKTIERYKKKIENATDQDIKLENSIANNDKGSEFWIRDLLNSARGKRIKGMLTRQEWESFCEDWAGYHMQLDDLNHTEENNIEQIIMLKLRIDKNQSDYSKNLDLRDTLMRESGVRDIKDLDLTDPNQAQVYEKVFAASLRLSDLNKEYKELLEKSTKISESLNITRKQREEKGTVGADTLVALFKKYDSKKTRTQEGRMAELMKISMEKKTNELRNAIEFMDGEIAPQLLDAETVKQMGDKNE